MSKKFKKFLLFATASAAIISAFVIIDKKRKECDSLFEDDDTEETNENDTLKNTKFSIDKVVPAEDSSRTYINLV